MTDHQTRLVAAALIRNGDEVLLVQQQGPDDPEPNWALPGGIVEPGEVLVDTLAREVREETGLAVTDSGRLLYCAHVAGMSVSWAAYIFEILEWAGQLAPDDPDGFILSARFLPVPEAIERLEALPWRAMREPIVAYLRGEEQPGTLWAYRDNPDSTSELVQVLTNVISG